MLDRLTVLELTAAALVVLGVLSVIAHFVNKARAKASAADSGKTGAVERPSPVAMPEPHYATPPAASATSPAAVVNLPFADDVPPSSESLLPPVEPIPPARDAPLPEVETVPSAGRSVSERFSRFAKPRAVPAARPKNAVRLKATRSSKIKRRPKRGNAPNERRLAPVAKAKPALTRRPKRVTQVRRKRIAAPVRPAGKVVAHRSPHLAPD